MSNRNCSLLAGATALALMLAGCGGGGGGVASMPTPTPTPTPSPSVGPTDVTIFSTPAMGTLATAGVSVQSTGRSETESALRFSGMSRDSADQLQLRYNADGTYEVKFPGKDWDTLINDPSVVNPTSSNDLFAAEHATDDQLAMRGGKYEYSVLGSWSSKSPDRFGIEAFGMATPANAIPTTGSATFTGVAQGLSDVGIYDDLYMSYNHLPVYGEVDMTLDFAKASLTGSLTLAFDTTLSDPVGTFAFTGTNFSASDGSYSGRFVSGTPGENFFFGQLTGPHAEETIGAWAVPFIYSGDAHQAFGAWIAKQ